MGLQWTISKSFSVKTMLRAMLASVSTAKSSMGVMNIESIALWMLIGTLSLSVVAVSLPLWAVFVALALDILKGGPCYGH